jgi:diaminopimelate decarboxylase
MLAPPPWIDPPWHELIGARPHLKAHAQDGLVFEDVPLNAIADAVGTPTWVYGAGTIRARLAAVQAAFAAASLAPAIRYAVKANDHRAILALMRQGGAGADVTSAGELARALAAGIAPDRIVFSGVGKTGAEIEAALAAGIGQINVESAEELAMISAIATAMGKPAPIALRVNPDIDAASHTKITTGRAGDKFGIPHAQVPALYREAAARPGLNPLGLAVHIGSQIIELAPYEAAYARMAALIQDLREAGLPLTRLDLGGGFGIAYQDGPGFPLEAYAHMVRRVIGALGCELVIEPGRYLVGPAGLLLTSVTLVKQTEAKRFMVLDAGMNDLLRPALYDAFHGMVPVGAADYMAPGSACEVVGPVCETGDRFAADRLLPSLAPGARLALLDAGAYGAVMSSTYNARPLAAQALVDGGRFHVIRLRQPIEALWRDETVPDVIA